MIEAPVMRLATSIARLTPMLMLLALHAAPAAWAGELIWLGQAPVPVTLTGFLVEKRFSAPPSQDGRPGSAAATTNWLLLLPRSALVRGTPAKHDGPALDVMQAVVTAAKGKRGAALRAKLHALRGRNVGITGRLHETAGGAAWSDVAIEAESVVLAPRRTARGERRDYSDMDDRGYYLASDRKDELAWVEYGPAVATLRGFIVNVRFRGPPNHGDDPGHDRKASNWLLLLRRQAQQDCGPDEFAR